MKVAERMAPRWPRTVELDPQSERIAAPGRRLVDRIENCRIGDTIRFNVTPFKVVGVFDCEGPANSEIWGDRDRMGEALERNVFNRVIAKLGPDVDIEDLKERMAEHPRVPSRDRTTTSPTTVRGRKRKMNS